MDIRSILGAVLIVIGVAYLLVPIRVARANARLSMFGDTEDVAGFSPTVFRIVGALFLLVGVWAVVGDGVPFP
jgi:hypothetical protein